MAKSTKATANKATKAQATKVKEVKKVEKETAKTNATKLNLVSIQEINELYKEAGITPYNPEGKGAYRIMGRKSGSSLNIKPTKGYYIYSTDTDFAALKEAKIEGVTLEEGTNSTDKVRPNTVIITAIDALKAALKVYANNYKVVATAEAEK